MSSDFFGEYVAPGIFLAGAGVSIARGVKEIRSRNTLTSPFQTQKEHEQILNAFSSAQKKEPMSAKRVAKAFFGDQQIVDGLADPLGTRMGLKVSRENVINSASKKFQLGDSISKFFPNMNGTLDINETRLVAFLESNPQYREHLESAARSQGLFALSERGLQGMPNWEQQANRVSERLIKGAQFGTTVDGYLTSINQLTAAGDLGSIDKSTVLSAQQFSGITDINQLPQFKDRPDLLEHIGGVHAQVQEINSKLPAGHPGRINMTLNRLNRGGQEIITGMQFGFGKIESNRPFLTLPFEDMQSIVRLGSMAQTEYIALNVLSHNAKDLLLNGTVSSPSQLFTRFDEALWRRFAQRDGEGVFSQIASGRLRGSKVLREFIGTHKDDHGKPLRELAANPAANEKMRMQALVKPLSITPSLNEDQVSLLDDYLRKQGFNSIAATSANQATNSVRTFPTADGHIIGTDPLGMSSDNKSAAQTTRASRITGGSHGSTNILLGEAQAAAGDTPYRMRVHSMQESIGNEILSLMGRADLHLHEDEAILGSSINYETHKTFQVSGQSSLPKNIGDLFLDKSTEGQALIKALREDNLDAYVKSLPLDEAIAVQSKLRLNAGDIVGLDEHGAFQAVSESSSGFSVRSIYSETLANGDNLIGLKGNLSFQADIGDKFFNWKHIIKERMSNPTIRKIAAVHQMVTQDPMFHVISNMPEGEERSRLITDMLREPIEHLEKFEAKTIKGALAKGEIPNINYLNAFDKTESQTAWKRAWGSTEGVQALDVQGFKKMEDATLPQVTHNMMENIGGRINHHYRLVEKITDGVTLNPRQQKTFNRLSTHLAENAEDIAALGFSRYAAPNTADGTVLRIIDGPGAPNLIDRFEAALRLTVKSKGVGEWTASRFFDDITRSSKIYHLNKKGMLSEAQQHIDEVNRLFGPDVAQHMRIAAGYEPTLSGVINSEADGSVEDFAADLYKRLSKDGVFGEANPEGRAAWMEAISKQLQYGTMNRTVSSGGKAPVELGAGRAASLNMGRIRHMRTQGGVMSDIAEELISRTSDKRTADQTEMFSRLYAFDDGKGIDPTKAIKLDAYAQQSLPEEVLDDLFSSNQSKRDIAFAEARSRFGVEGDKGLIFDLGEKQKNRYIYHPQAVGTQSGDYVTRGGQAIRTDLDEALHSILTSASTSGVESNKTALAINTYSQELTSAAQNREGALARGFNGEVNGSKRLQARSQAQASFFKELEDGGSYFKEHFKDKVGIRRDVFAASLEKDSPMAAQAMNDLLEGKAPVLIGRSPDTELHRITLATAYDLDSALEGYARHKTKGLDTSEIMAKLFSLDRERHDQLASHLADLQQKQRELYSAHQAWKSQPSGNRQQARQYLNSLMKHHNITEDPKRPLGAQLNIRNADRERKLVETAYVDAFRAKHQGMAILLPEQAEMRLGADYDNDIIDFYTLSNKDTYSGAQRRILHHEELLRASRLDKNFQPAVNDEEFIAKFTKGRVLSADELKGQEDFLYSIRQKQLYKTLKNKTQIMPTREQLTVGTAAWEDWTSAQRMTAYLEKAEIGSMSNATDAVRTIFRRRVSAANDINKALFGEMLLGIMPESILKVRQVASDKVASTGSYSEKLREALRGNFTGTMDEAVTQFRSDFMNLHQAQDTPLLQRIASHDNIRELLESAKEAKAKGDEFRIERALKSIVPTPESREELTHLLGNSKTPGVHGEAYRAAIADRFGVQEGATSRKIKNLSTSMSDAYDIMLKHKKPLMIGAGLAIATSMLLGSPGSISSEEADAAGARHLAGDPTTPPTDMGHSARVSTGGNSVRVRGSSNGDIDRSSIMASLNRRFPGADISMNVDDYRKRINEEYIRRRMENG